MTKNEFITKLLCRGFLHCILPSNSLLEQMIAEYIGMEANVLNRNANGLDLVLNFTDEPMNYHFVLIDNGYGSKLCNEINLTNDGIH